MNIHPSASTRRGVLYKTLAFALLSAPAFLIGQSVWLGAEAEDSNWGNLNNWEFGTLPTLNSGGTAIINSGTVSYDGATSGDLMIGQGGSLTMNEGSWTQTAGIAWIKIGNVSGTGTLNINSGASFNSGTSTGFHIGQDGGTGIVNVNGGTLHSSVGATISSGSKLNSTGSATITIVGNLELSGTVNASGGTLSYSTLTLNSGAVFKVNGASVTHGGNFDVQTDRTLEISEGALTIAGELKPTGGGVLISGGTVTANLISFDGVPANTAPLELSGGILTITGNFNGGIWNSANSYVNFTEGSTAQLIFTSVASDIITAKLGNTIRFNDGTTTSDFVVNSYGNGGTIVTIASTIPEPATYAILAGVAILGIASIRRKKNS